MNLRRIVSEEDIEGAVKLLDDYSTPGQLPRSFEYARDDGSSQLRMKIMKLNATSDYSQHYIGQIGGRPMALGTMQLLSVGKHTWGLLENLVVRRADRGRGHGVRLVRQLCCRAFEAGVDRVFASVFAASNPDIITMARKGGMGERFVKRRWRSSIERAEVPSQMMLERVARSPSVEHDGIRYHRYNCIHYLAVRGVIGAQDCEWFRAEEASASGLYIVETFVRKDEITPAACEERMNLADRLIFDVVQGEFDRSVTVPGSGP